jgi:outer membrane autotransporter protein
MELPLFHRSTLRYQRGEVRVFRPGGIASGHMSGEFPMNVCMMKARARMGGVLAPLDFRLLPLRGMPVRSRRRSSLLTAMLLGTSALVAVPGSPSFAQTVWDGSASSDWDTPANWDTNAVPTGANDVVIDDISVNAPVIGSGVNAVADAIYIGEAASGAGSITITGTGTLTSAGWSYIGFDGTGSILVQNSGTASIADSSLGDSVTGVGEVTVTGAGSFWFSNSVSVGYRGIGTFTVSNGGHVLGEAFLGDNTGSGTVLVTGVDSVWTSLDEFMIGGAGTGQLTVSDGGAVEVVNILTIGWAVGSSGTALVTGAGSSIGVGNNFIIGLNGDGSLTVANGGTAGTLVLAANAGSTGELNIGNGGAAGQLIANWVQFGDGDGALNFNHNEDDYDFGIGIMGAGAINHLAGVTTLSGNGVSYAGTATVSGGLLNVNGLFGGIWDVVSGGTLGGTGSIGDAAVSAGGVLSPGNSIGTLNIANDIVFDAGSFFDIEVDADGNGDLLLVGNTATINGGTVRVAPAAGTYAASTQYTILTANMVSGAFDDVTSSFAFLTPSLTYDAQNVFLTLNLASAFQDAALTPNQFNVAGAAEDLGAGNAIYDEILVMTEEEARAAFDALSGEAHAGTHTGLFHSAQQIREALLARLRALSGGQGPKTAAIAGPPAAGDAVPGAAAIWGQVFGSTGETDGDGNAASLDRSAYGFLGGIDRPVGEASRIGVALGYSRSDFDVDARASSGDAGNFHAAAYAGTKLGSVDLSVIAAYSFGQVETDRTVIVGGLTDRLSADYDAHTFQAAAEAGIDLDAGSVTLTPFAGLALIHAGTDGFTETGGPSALTVASESNTTGVSTLGLRARREEDGFAVAGSAAWRHAFGDTDPASRAAFASAPASAFTVRGVPISENALALDASIGANLGAGATLTLGYAGEFASDARGHGLRAELRLGF